MKLFIRINRFFKSINRRTRHFVYLFKLKTGKIIKAKIIKPEVDGVKVCAFKDRTKESFIMPRVFEFINEGRLVIDYQDIALWKFNNSKVFYKSDIVLTDKGNVIWPKYFKYNYNHNIPLDRITTNDSDGLCEHNGFLSIMYSKRITELNAAFSMIGVFDDIWAHALVEYIPKLSVLDKAIKDCPTKITVILPEYKDKQLKEIVFSLLNKYDVNVYQVSEKETIMCNTLYYIERPTSYTDHEMSVSVGDSTIPQKTATYLKEAVVEVLKKDVVLDPKYKKLFLVRRGGIGKGILNCSEVENYFEELGFVFVEPHKISLKEKVSMFMSADFIVGPGGAAFTNLIFCRPGTKVIKFSNYQRVFENYSSMLIQYFGIDLLYLTGFDDKSAINPAHCSYYLPLERVKQACAFHGII